MSSTDSPDDEPLFDPRITKYPWPWGILSGVLSFGVGYLVMALVILGNNGITPLVETPRQVVVDIGLTFYNSQQVVANVNIVGPIANPEVLPKTFDLLSGSTDLPKVIYYAVPVVVLLGIGVLVAWKTLDENASLGEAVLPAMAVSVGYTTVAALGTFIVRRDRLDGTVQLVPDLTQAIIFGLAYSLTCALIGSVAVLIWQNRANPEQIRLS